MGPGVVGVYGTLCLCRAMVLWEAVSKVKGSAQMETYEGVGMFREWQKSKAVTVG